ncbi:MAG: SPOR domain-containing protein [Sphingopyxis sp.]|uniref:SPOR domain-containing protein n=1 Tax=Sphingopyxis sp. TaxID=1908224 RepID=UPI002AB8DE6E|nr:SPOR domain-containing protein [Sphingopyxis sp.]MDZ3833764.1 SPOR domain-containing protein [Sphingopyxis sp.]
MNSKLLMKLAISGFAIGMTATGCSTAKMANAPSNMLGKPETASKSADKARAAMEQGKTAKAVALAEATVSASPRDAGYRTLLGQAYLNDGRFASARTALSEAMQLGAADGNTIIALALTHIAQGQMGSAVDLLSAHRDSLPAADLGLALALAGDLDASVYVLTEAARTEGADARTRQNLALAFALSGRWAQARVLAAQDLSLDKVEARMIEWSKLAEQPEANVRVASLIGTRAQPGDAGMPVRLALSNFTDVQMADAAPAVELASADPAPVETFAPPPPVLADAGGAIRSIELPMPERGADGAVPVTDLPQPAPAAEVILADAAPYRAAPRVAGEASERLRPAQRQALELATSILPKALAFDAKNPNGWAVQLGAYDSLGIAKEKWGTLKKRNAMLASYPASSHAAVVGGRTFHRLTVNGLANRNDATKLCGQLKAQGQQCFIRAMGGGENIQWAARAQQLRLAAR